MKIGFVVNPWAGIGGAVALKGSDGSEIRAEALALGARQRANEKALTALTAFVEYNQFPKRVSWFTGAADMGASTLALAGIASLSIVPGTPPLQTESTDTALVVDWFKNQNVDLIVFAGGDGTARDICGVVGTQIPVLGIPAGVKIHSGVFAVTAHAAGEVLAGLVDGQLTELHCEEVRDIDEDAFRNNRVRAKFYGEMNVPVAGEFMQHVKVGGVESEPMVLSDIADWLIEELDPDTCYFIGSGGTTATLMEHLDIRNTLLGIDAIKNGQVLKTDCTENDLLELLSCHSCMAIISVIGGQGHILGRGNAQFSPQVLKLLGRDNLLVVGSKAKLKSLEGRPLYLDTTDPALDRQWAGIIPIITGYNNKVIYPVVAL